MNLLAIVVNILAARRKKGAKEGPRPSVLPRLEPLEDRTVLAVYTWIGKGADSNWTTYQNWATVDAAGETHALTAARPFTAADTFAFTSLSKNANSIDNISGLTIGTLNVRPGYTGAITLAKDLTLTNGGLLGDAATIQGG